ncbi:hypothetical protein Acj9p191 [Acinetobacter phage Acj9]|uniref:Uncharacterized protein n=1 Tax=Acinetobacter phage Acj9 TaxID=760939 RepID=E5EPX5_9CAUD|nr:hypothetical protein Acj9p191 [Acinetobacter phage Acj9]ADG60091.1 hypothetical protein Acj9p191 [Acinetobacter phage Acj9]
MGYFVIGIFVGIIVCLAINHILKSEDYSKGGGSSNSRESALVGPLVEFVFKKDGQYFVQVDGVYQAKSVVERVPMNQVDTFLTSNYNCWLSDYNRGRYKTMLIAKESFACNLHLGNSVYLKLRVDFE